jgi:hypothetical protein
VPAEVGLVPQTVSAARLQQANALQGLSRNMVGVLGPAVGGAIVVAGSPGVALAVDAASFVGCAVLLAQIRVPRRARDAAAASFFRELLEGWSEFRSRTWLWASVGFFGVSNLFWVGSWSVLGPTIADAELGGAGAWATVLTFGGAGSILGGLLAIRIRPERPLLVSVLAPIPMMLPLVALALHAPVLVLAAAAALSFAGLSVHLTLWFTVFQREVPEQHQSRVSSYDALGSFVLNPVGAALAGPMAAAIGVETTIWVSVAVMACCLAIIGSLRSVREITAGPDDVRATASVAV